MYVCVCMYVCMYVCSPGPLDGHKVGVCVCVMCMFVCAVYVCLYVLCVCAVCSNLQSALVEISGKFSTGTYTVGVDLYSTV